MRHLIYFLTSILLISLQTTLGAAVFPWVSLYDLLIPFIVFLVLFRSIPEALTTILLAGIAMDLLSGAPMGVYLLVYLLLFLLFRNAKLYFHLPGSVLFQIVFVLGVLIELMIFSTFYTVSLLSFHISFKTIWIASSQLIWAVITGRPLFILLDNGYGFLENLFAAGSGKI